MSKIPPARCFLCNAPNGIVPAGFHQIYPQNGSAPALLDWWSCLQCSGWFVHPVPPADIIGRYWALVDYNNPNHAIETARAKITSHWRILGGLSRWVEPGPLLDFGCNFGEFLVMARELGWTPTGFEPYEVAANIARAKGFDVASAWSLEEAGFSEQAFSAITANDVFCLVWHPYETVKVFHSLLKPGGVLAMRLTNKQFVLGVVKALSTRGPTRNNRISTLLQGQFHSIGLTPLSRIIRSIGFDCIRIEARAITTPWRDLRWRTLIAYLGADLVRYLSLTTWNLSPGILLFARKSISR